MNNRKTPDPNRKLAKQSDENFAQAVAAGAKPEDAYRQFVYSGKDFSSAEKFRRKAYRKMRQEVVRARVEALRAEMRQETQGKGIDRGELIESLTKKYWEAYEAKCETMRDRADQARVLEILANRIILLKGVGGKAEDIKRVEFAARTRYEEEAVPPPPKAEAEQGGGQI